MAEGTLTEKHCRPCEGGEAPLPEAEARRLLREVPDWRLEGNAIVLDRTFRDFRSALRWVDEVGELAEREGHHPDLLLHGYKNVRVTLSTHAVGGLTENDFILAAKVDRVRG